MTQQVPAERDTAFRVSLDMHSICLTDDQFYRLSSDNPDLRLELSARGELVIMSPTNTDTGWRGARITQRLANWTERDGTGLCFDSSTGFRLPNGAKRSPDASWISRVRWQSLTAEERQGLARVCPDFVLELRSVSDTLPELQDKMTEYLQSGARLGWLLDPLEKKVYIYRPATAGIEGEVIQLVDPGILVGDEVLRGFRFDFRELLEEPE